MINKDEASKLQGILELVEKSKKNLDTTKTELWNQPVNSDIILGMSPAIESLNGVIIQLDKLIQSASKTEK